MWRLACARLRDGVRLDYMENGKPKKGSKWHWAKLWLDYYSDVSHRLMSPEAMHLGPYFMALAKREWDQETYDQPLLNKGKPITRKQLQSLTGYGERTDSLIDELIEAGFLGEKNGQISVLSFKKWQDRKSGGLRKEAGGQRTEDRGQKGRGTEGRRDVARAWERLVEVRKELIPRARSSTLHARGRKVIADRIAEHGIETVLAVINHRAAEVKRDPAQAKWLQWETIFRPRNFDRTVGMIGTGGPRDTTLHVVGEDYNLPPGEVSL